jgi:signal transduction histidine kinase
LTAGYTRSENETVDPLAGVELVATAEELSSRMRHEVRNKLAAARNASTYIRRRLGGSEAWKSDPRVETFYGMMEAELEAANASLEPAELLARVHRRKVERVDAARTIERAVEHARISEVARRALSVHADPGQVTADPSELALAIRCLIENAAEAGGAAGIDVRGRAEPRRYSFVITDDGPGTELSLDQASEPFFTTKEGHAGLGLAIARRVARRFGGDIELGPSATTKGLVASLQLPLADGR